MPLNHKFKTHHLVFDFFLSFTFFLFLTGGLFFIRGNLQELINQKPWMHRLTIAFFTGAALLWYAWNDYRVRSGKDQDSPLIRGIKSIPWSSRTWTWLVFFVSSATWTLSSWIRHEVFHTSFDMAIFVQAVWNTLQGNFLYSSIKGGICLLSDHFSPILVLLTVPYKLWTDPKCLLLFWAS